jgi:hypothetical protein
MDKVFAAALAEWTTFYTFVGGAAATLLGLLFVSVSLRLDIFRQREVADVRDFAAVTFASFLVALVVAGLALAPHQRWPTLALPLLALGLGGLAVVGYLVREWLRLNPRASGPRPGVTPSQWQGWASLAGLAAPFAGLVVVALLLWGGRAGALAGLAVVEGGLLGMATASAWLLLARAGGRPED